MPTALPPINEADFEQHSRQQLEQAQQEDAQAIANARAAQEQADQATRDEFARTARADVQSALEPLRQQQARTAFLETARAGVQDALAPLRSALSRVQVPQAPTAAQLPWAGGAAANPLQRVYQDARSAGLDDEGARAAVAVAQTEQGYTGALGDNGVSAGTFQLHHAGGQGSAYAASRGISPDQSIAELQRDPNAANQWALRGYLGDAIRQGQAQGLTGPELAAYAQRYGQRSVSPERAGQNYQAAQDALGGPSGGPVTDFASTGPPAPPEAQTAPSTPAGVSDERSQIRARAQEYVGTPYLWGGADKQGIDCSAFISRAWGVGRQTTDTLGTVADPIPKEELTPGDAMNLTTGQDPRGYGHVRMFDGWADPGHTQMYVYESSTATGGVARRVIPYDAAYTPMRLRGLAADPTQAAARLHATAPPMLAEQAQPSRPTTVPIQSDAGVTTEGDRPSSEFEQPAPPTPEPMEQTIARLGRLAAPALTGRYADLFRPGAAQDVRALGRNAADIVAERYRDIFPPEGSALRAGQPLAVTPESPLIDVAMGLTPEPVARLGAQAAGELARLHLEKLPEAVRDVVQQAAEREDFWRTTQRRGVIPDAEAEAMADRLGRSVDQMIAGGKVGAAYNAETLRAMKNGIVAQGMDVVTRAREMAQNPTGVTDAMRAEQLAAGMKLADLTRVFEGGRAEAGRAMRAFQSFARDYAADPTAAVQRIFRSSNLTPEQATVKANEFAKMVADGADPFQMARFWSSVERPPVHAGDWFRLLRYNAMLSGPRTMEVNVASGLTEVPWRAARDIGASVLTGDVRPLRPEAEAAAAGLVRGLGSARQILAHGLTEEQARAGDVPRSLSARLEGRLPRAIATGLEAPGRVLGAANEVVRQVAYGMARGREAGIQASREGLSGPAWRARVDELMADPTPSPGALAAAERTTFKGPMGDLGEKVLAPLQAWAPMGVPVGNVLVPFLRSVYHITSQGVERTPVLGTIGTAADVLRGQYGPLSRANLRAQLGAMQGPTRGVTPLGERVGNNLMGSVAFAGLSLAAAQGNITGKGPSDPEKRRMMQAQGWQPYSVKIGDRWVSYANWGPMAIPLSLAAAMHEGEGKTTPAYLYDVFERGANVLTEQSYLQGVGAIFKAMDPTRGSTFGEQSLEQFLATLVPYGAAINTAAQATDPLMRVNERGDITGALAARIPGLRETVPPQQDVLGRPVPNPQEGLAAVQPLRTSPERPDPVLGALLEAGVDVGPPPTTVAPGSGLSVELTPEEQRAYQRSAGAAIVRTVERYLASDKSRTDTPARRAATLKIYVETAREQAKNDVLRAMGSDQIRARMRARSAR